jgi:hypothetical protein
VNEIQTAGWANFFSAEVSASAALTGLVVVAISINLARILSDKHLPGRAAEALILLGGVLVLMSAALIPHQPMVILGLVTLTVSLAMLLGPVVIQMRAFKARVMPNWRVFVRALLTAAPSLAMVTAGLLLVFGHPSALYWIAAGAILCLISGVSSAWALLIEILR